MSRTIEEQFVTLRRGEHKHIKYNTVAQAVADGAIVWPWGSFIDKVLRFLLIALALYSIARLYGWISHDDIIKKQVKCTFCRKSISPKAKRCVNCTSWLDGRDDKNAQESGSNPSQS